MLRTVKPRNARSKRALEARAPKEVEDPRTAIFVKGTHTGDVLNNAIKDLMALKRPHAISFSKKNAIRPFEDASSIGFWANKNDASLFVVGQSTKKRPNGLTFIRTFDHRVLDMFEVGIENYKSMDSFKGPKSTPGHRPLMHFASELFDTHPRFIQLKSMLLDFFGSEVVDAIHLSGVEHVISVSLAPTPSSTAVSGATADLAPDASSGSATLPTVHFRVYSVKMLPSGSRTPRVELTPMGPSMDMVMRRHQDADIDMWKAAMKRPKLKKKDVEQGLGKRKKNVDVDEMGDVRGRIHVAKQDLNQLQTRKMKGLKDTAHSDDSGSDQSDDEPETLTAKRRRKE